MVSADVETLSLTALGALAVYTAFKKQKLHLSTAFEILSWNIQRLGSSAASDLELGHHVHYDPLSPFPS